MQRVIQLRYYGENDNRNYPNEEGKKISAENLITGQIFQEYIPIVQLGVQYDSDLSIPFYINEGGNPILTHPYGLFELDLTDKTAIQVLRFNVLDENGQSKITNGKPLIIDIVYKE